MIILSYAADSISHFFPHLKGWLFCRTLPATPWTPPPSTPWINGGGREFAIIAIPICSKKHDMALVYFFFRWLILSSKIFKRPQRFFWRFMCWMCFLLMQSNCLHLYLRNISCRCISFSPEISKAGEGGGAMWNPKPPLLWRVVALKTRWKISWFSRMTHVSAVHEVSLNWWIRLPAETVGAWGDSGLPIQRLYRILNTYTATDLYWRNATKLMNFRDILLGLPKMK